MDDSRPEAAEELRQLTEGSAPQGDARFQQLTQLLADLDDPPACVRGTPLQLQPAEENQLLQVRLGVASSLFMALRWKHEPTARHCLRVALSCSAWAGRMGLPAAERDELELAALLHDIGKIGVPDQILAKPCPLSPQESAVMDGHWLMGQDILRHCCASKSLQEIVACARAWYDGSKPGMPIRGADIPAGARMLAIVDAFEAMTTDHVYRRAMSRERAFHELYRFAGAQFDPQLVQSFSELHECDQVKLLEQIPRRWLHALDPATVNSVWRRNDAVRPAPCADRESLFERRLIENMREAVIFVDVSLRITLWNAGAERLTGISAESACHRLWLPSMLRLRDEHGRVILDDQCPLAYALQTGTQWIRRLNLRGRDGTLVPVDAHAVPVLAPDGTTQGLALELRDASQETTLAEHCQSLHELATRDPLTQVANRAEFDRMLDLLIAAHQANKHPCSLIIADIDEFKRVNDTYGHQTGDDVIRSFAMLLKTSCRTGDLVARYGGEEFVLLCSDCDSAAVARRAEHLRGTFSRTPQEGMHGECVTASFGVTEIQPGDTPDTMLRRADRALLLAKEQGRNKVVQLGSGAVPEGTARPSRWSKKSQATGEAIVQQRLACDVPLSVSVEKLRGFIADHHAHVAALEGNRVTLSISCGPPARLFSAEADRPSQFLLELEYREERAPDAPTESTQRNAVVRTLIDVAIRPHSTRDRRHKPLHDRARQLLVSLRAYLMASEPVDPAEVGVLARARHLLHPRRGKK